MGIAQDILDLTDFIEFFFWTELIPNNNFYHLGFILVKVFLSKKLKKNGKDEEFLVTQSKKVSSIYILSLDIFLKNLIKYFYQAFPYTSSEYHIH